MLTAAIIRLVAPYRLGAKGVSLAELVINFRLYHYIGRGSISQDLDVCWASCDGCEIWKGNLHPNFG